MTRYDDDELFGGELRRALHAEAERVQPAGDGLARIQARVARRRARMWWRTAALGLGMAGVFGAAAGGVVLFGSDPDDGTSTLPGGRGGDGIVSTVSPSPAPTVAAPTTPSRSAPPAGSGGGAAVPVYYLGETTSGVRLFREYRSAPRSAAKVEAALGLMFVGPVDPDYESAWPAGTRVLSYRPPTGGVATVDLSATAASGASGGRSAELTTGSLQQLVYTVQAAIGDPDVAVRLRVAGRTVDRLWGHDVVQPLRRAPRAEMAAPVSILTPDVDGSEVTGPVVSFGGESVGAARVSWELLRGAAVVAGGLDDVGPRGAWNGRATLAPGRYLLRVATAGGTDTKTIVVR